VHNFETTVLKKIYVKLQGHEFVGTLFGRNGSIIKSAPGVLDLGGDDVAEVDVLEAVRLPDFLVCMQIIKRFCTLYYFIFSASSDY
jgi:hypothetical protein